MGRVYSGPSTNGGMGTTAMMRTGWRPLCFLFFALLALVLLSSSCSQRQELEATSCPVEPSIQQRATSLLFPEFITILEDALEVRISAGGYSSSIGRLQLDYHLSSAPLHPSESANRLKQEFESLGAKGVEAGIIGGTIIVDFEQLPFKSYVWHGFIHVYDQRLLGYLELISSGG
jgi:hypothetical protein